MKADIVIAFDYRVRERMNALFPKISEALEGFKLVESEDGRRVFNLLDEKGELTRYYEVGFNLVEEK